MKFFLFYAASVLSLTAAEMVQPVATFQRLPQYPFEMRRYGIQGSVTVDFEVDAGGSVRNAQVVASTNRAFDRSALSAINLWKFRPATLDGKPVVSARIRIPIYFNLTGGGGGGYQIEVPKDQSKIPPAFRFDTPPKVKVVAVPIYPYELRREKTPGKVRAALMIDPRGRVSDVRVIKAEKPAFGMALVAALEGFQFEPAKKDGKEVPHVLNFEQDFNLTEFRDERAEALIAIEKKSPEQITSEGSLDVPLTPTLRREPLFPISVDPRITSGEAEIECLIDVDGSVRLARIVSASEPAFGYAAVQAASGWWFEQPLAGSKPVIARARLPFKFSAK